MMRTSTLIFTEPLAAQLHAHLFPGDGLEAAALLLCTEVRGQRLKLLVREFLPVPYAACARQPDAIVWPGNYLEAAIEQAEARGDLIIAIHAHPGGWLAFSSVDDASDRVVLPALWHGTGRRCGTAIMTSDGAIRARLTENGAASVPVDLVLIAGRDLRLFWHAAIVDGRISPPPMAFASGMTAWLQRLSVCVVGVSGTGSVVAEQLARLGVGEIILIDFDRIEARNLNRILNATEADIGRLKVDVLAEAIHRHHPACRVVSVPAALGTREAVIAAADADLLFSCVDTANGRHQADRLCAALLMPLIDIGVTIPTVCGADGQPRIAEVCGRVDYVFPGGSSLMDRGIYDGVLLQAEYLAQAAPDVHAGRVKEGYIRGVAEEAPAVIAVNMRAASIAVLEAIARMFPFRERPNAEHAQFLFLLAEGVEESSAEATFTPQHTFALATGLAEPLLGLPALAAPKAAA